ncbi:MAG: hypothetical protein AB2693_28205 [Candidatus Thiodiazotropha sp.]
MSGLSRVSTSYASMGGEASASEVLARSCSSSSIDTDTSIGSSLAASSTRLSIEGSDTRRISRDGPVEGIFDTFLSWRRSGWMF